MEEKIRLGIAACLLGEKVRYDGGHKYASRLVETLGLRVEFVPVCPERECGLGVPREAMCLEGDPADPRLVTIGTGIDHTDRMKQWAVKKLGELENEKLCGYIFKSKSPSCSLERLQTDSEPGLPERGARGLWATSFIRRFPLLPVEDECRLNDPESRENFIGRVSAIKRKLSGQSQR